MIDQPNWIRDCFRGSHSTGLLFELGWNFYLFCFFTVICRPDIWDKLTETQSLRRYIFGLEFKIENVHAFSVLEVGLSQSVTWPQHFITSQRYTRWLSSVNCLVYRSVVTPLILMTKGWSREMISTSHICSGDVKRFSWVKWHQTCISREHELIWISVMYSGSARGNFSWKTRSIRRE